MDMVKMRERFEKYAVIAGFDPIGYSEKLGYFWKDCDNAWKLWQLCEKQYEVIGKVHQNSAGQVHIQGKDGDSFDMINYINVGLFARVKI